MAALPGWRVNYEEASYLLADRLVALSAPWSGRRPGQGQAADLLMVPVRSRHRSPDNSEG